MKLIAGNVSIGKIKDANIECDYGDVEIDEVSNKCSVAVDCGNVKVDKLLIKENSDIKADLGNISINETNDIYIDANVDLGKTNIGKNNRSADVVLKLVCNCGNVNVRN